MFTKDHIRQLVYNLEILSINSEHAHEDSVVYICDWMKSQECPMNSENGWSYLKDENDKIIESL
jgi:hypothetical protein